MHRPNLRVYDITFHKYARTPWSDMNDVILLIYIT